MTVQGLTKVSQFDLQTLPVNSFYRYKCEFKLIYCDIEIMNGEQCQLLISYVPSSYFYCRDKLK